jgi:hypothetical protein
MLSHIGAWGIWGKYASLYMWFYIISNDYFPRKLKYFKSRSVKTQNIIEVEILYVSPIQMFYTLTLTKTI